MIEEYWTEFKKLSIFQKIVIVLITFAFGYALGVLELFR